MGSIFSGLFELLTSNVSDIVAYGLTTIFFVVGQLTAIVAKALNMAVFVEPGGNVLIVETTWKILRDFSNMIFIVLLIYMAFATIFDHGKYRFQDMIVRFLIVAVLINFSLVIGNFIIDACQVLTNIFLGSIGNLGDRLGQYLNPSLLLPNPETITGADMAGGMLISIVFAIILSLIFLFSMLVALVFAIVRVPIIWALLIVSPFAWMSHILPSSNVWWGKWWRHFFGWNLFLPVYLFFMYLGLIFLSQRDTIIGAVLNTAQTASGTNPANDPLLAGLVGSLSFNLVFFYLFAAFVMVGGTWAAKETTSLMGTGFDKGLGWAKGMVKRAPLPYIGNLQAGETAAKARYGQFQQEGFKQGGFVNRWTGGAANKIYGGKDAQTRADEKALSRFGVTGSSKDFVKNADKSFSKFEDEYDNGKLTVSQLVARVQSTKATTPDGYAYRKLAIKKGALKDQQFVEALLSAENNPFAVRDLIKTAKDVKFSGIKDLKAIAFDSRLTGANFTPAKREILLHMAGDAKLSSKFSNTEEIGKSVTILGGKDSPESTKFLDDLAKARPDLVFQYRADNNLFSQPAEDATGKKSTMATLYGTLRKSLNTEPKNIAAMPDDLWKNTVFQQALKEKLYDQNISRKNRNNLRINLERILGEQGDDDKIIILNEIAPRYEFAQNTDNESMPKNTTQGEVSTDKEPVDEEDDEEETESNTPAEGEGEKPTETGEGTAKTVSYLKTMGINRSNVIDLRTADLKNKTEDE